MSMYLNAKDMDNVRGVRSTGKNNIWGLKTEGNGRKIREKWKGLGQDASSHI